MFYLQTKDGERFFTGKHSDDKEEFEKIIEAKMGKEAAEMFNELIGAAEIEGEESVSLDGYVETDYVVDIASDLEDVIKQLQITVNEPNMGKSDIQIYLNELLEIYSKLVTL